MRAIWLTAICVAALGLGAAPAQAFRPLVEDEVLNSQTVPGEGVEGACGVAIGGGTLYVSDYYRHRVDLFNPNSGVFSAQIAAPNLADGVCGLALSGGVLYANEWHESVVRLSPSVKVFDTGHESTAVAVDAAGNVYASNRTYVAVYQPSGDPVLDEGQPLKIGLGGLGDAYGVAVSGLRTYVADAATETVKVFEAAGDPATPVAEIDHGFTSLRDGALAIDPTNGHLLVLDNLQPGFESPKAAIDEFDAAGTFLGQLTTPKGIVHGAPSGLAVDAAGNVFVTTGNSEGSNVVRFGPYSSPGFSPASSPPALSPPAAAGSGASGADGAAPVLPSRRRAAATASEVAQHGDVRVALQAKLTPKQLPRTGRAPVHFSIAAKIGAAGGAVGAAPRGGGCASKPNGKINPGALPVCEMDQVQPASTQGALEACRGSLVGDGSFSAKVLLTQQSPFPSDGEVLAFNGSWHGKPAILAHIYGTQPVPTSFTLPFVIGKAGGNGPFGTALKASLPQFTNKWGYVTGISLSIGRSSAHGGYLTAGCPAPRGFGGASFPLTRAKLSFTDGSPRTIEQTLTRSCGVR